MSAFLLKIIACVSMILDHTSIVLFDGNNWMDYIGRLGFPIYAFLISEGYTHTKSLKNYLLRLLFAAIISQIPFMLISSADYVAINTIFTLIFGLIAIIIYDKINKYLGVITAIILGIIANTFHFDHGIYGVLVVFLFYVLRDKKVLKFILYELITIGWYIYRMFLYGTYYSKELFKYYFPYIIFSLLAVIPLTFYNEKRGYKCKYLFYIIYPVHLIILCLIKYIFLK